MANALLLARLVLAAVFLVAGAAKLADRTGSRRALVEFGVPPILAWPLGVVLPVAEITVGAALVPRATAVLAAVAALALLALFCAGIAANLVRGREPDCHCFGQLHSAPAGWPTLGRNALLALVAGFVVRQGWSDPGRSVVGPAGGLTAGEATALAIGLVLAAAVLAEGWLILNLLQQQGRLLARVETLEAGDVAGRTEPASEAFGLPVGGSAPEFQLKGLHGEVMTLAALRSADRPVLLVFSDPGCGPCNALMPDIGRWQREESAALTVALVSRGAVDANRAKSAEHGLINVLLQDNREVSEAYLSRGTPSAVLVAADGKIGSDLAHGAGQIRDLVARATGQPPPAGAGLNGYQAPAAARAAVGIEAPPLRLPDLNGKQVDLADYQGSDTLVLFWNPRCGFCQRMLAELRQWELAPPSGAPRLLVVSTGDADVNRAQGFRATVVLDEGFRTGRLFGAGGTPSAVLVDANGRVASDAAIGAPAVMALANREGVDVHRG